MKCPKCKYISFDHNENCPKCRKDLTEVRENMNFPAYCPLLATQAEIDSQIPDGSIRIEQKDDTIVEESMDMQFSDSQDFESAFDSSLDEALGESDLDFTLTEDAETDRRDGKFVSNSTVEIDSTRCPKWMNERRPAEFITQESMGDT